MLASAGPMRMAVIELPATWGEPERALGMVASILEQGPRADLVLLPEASLTGYVSPAGDFDLTPFAEPRDGRVGRALAALAAKHRVHLAGPLVLADPGGFFNATAVFGPAGEILTVYKKRHPWMPERWAMPGADPHPLLRLGGLSVTIACCFDVHFLEAEANAVLDEADLLLFPSAWVEDARTNEADSRLPLLSALARAHRIAIAAANWGPGIVRVGGQGGSAIFDANGGIVARVAPGELRADASL